MASRQAKFPVNADPSRVWETRHPRGKRPGGAPRGTTRCLPTKTRDPTGSRFRRATGRDNVKGIAAERDLATADVSPSVGLTVDSMSAIPKITEKTIRSLVGEQSFSRGED